VQAARNSRSRGRIEGGLILGAFRAQRRGLGLSSRIEHSRCRGGVAVGGSAIGNSRRLDHEPPEKPRRRREVRQFTFPYDQYAPTCSTQTSDVLAIAPSVSCNLLVPVIAIRFRCSCPAARCVPVPKATMDENGLLQPAEHNIRSARKILWMQTIPKTRRIQQSPDDQLRFGVLALDCPHDSASGFPWLHGYFRLIAISSDSATTAPARRMRFLRTVSAPLCSASKST